MNHVTRGHSITPLMGVPCVGVTNLGVLTKNAQKWVSVLARYVHMCTIVHV